MFQTLTVLFLPYFLLSFAWIFLILMKLGGRRRVVKDITNFWIKYKEKDMNYKQISINQDITFKKI